jgi:hypothetical protein
MHRKFVFYLVHKYREVVTEEFVAQEENLVRYYQTPRQWDPGYDWDMAIADQIFFGLQEEHRNRGCQVTEEEFIVLLGFKISEHRGYNKIKSRDDDPPLGDAVYYTVNHKTGIVLAVISLLKTYRNHDVTAREIVLLHHFIPGLPALPHETFPNKSRVDKVCCAGWYVDIDESGLHYITDKYYTRWQHNGEEVTCMNGEPLSYWRDIFLGCDELARQSVPVYYKVLCEEFIREAEHDSDTD